MFSMSDLGLLSYYLGIEVHQSAAGISLCQSSYAAKILERSGMADCNSVQVPMEARLHLSKASKLPAVDPTEFRSIVGSLRYLIHTRPDITYSVGIVSRYMASPTTEHMAAVKHILRYIQGTLNYGVHYSRGDGSSLCLCGYSDSDMAGDVEEHNWCYILLGFESYYLAVPKATSCGSFIL